VRVVIGEDEALLRHGLELVLTEQGFEVVAMAADGPDVVRKVTAHRPDLVLTDIRMPPGHRDEGLQAALEIRATMPEVAILVLSQHASRRYAQDLLADGAARMGYLLKQRVADTTSFAADLRRLVAGGTVLDPEVAASLVARARVGDSAIDTLTERQRQVLELMAQGRTNAGIAARLGVTEKAITRHTSLIYGALGLESDEDDHRRVLAVVRYLAHASS
jgi:DNA-binding NarL/FixJ family response regulator